MESNNATFVVQNISTGNQSASAWNLSEFSGEVGNTFTSQAAGSVQLGGLLGLTLMGFMLYKSDMNEEVSATVMVPSVFFLASEGYLPFGQGIVYAMLLAVSGIFIFGLLKYIDR